MLTTEAFNALLKTLEEPPPHIIFILATTEPHKIPQTILSRCQRYDFRRIGVDDIAGRIAKIADAEGIRMTPDARELIAELADGSMRDGLSILEQCASYGKEELRRADVADIVGIVDTSVLFEIAEAAEKGQTSAALKLVSGFLAEGKEVLSFFEDFIRHYRMLLLCKAAEGDAAELIEKTPEAAEKYTRQAETYSMERILYSITTLSEYLAQAKWMSDPQIAADMAAVKLCSPTYSSGQAALLARLEQLERKVAALELAPRPAADIPAAAAPNEAARKKTESSSASQDPPPWDTDAGEPENAETERVQTQRQEVPPEESTPSAESGTPWRLWSEALNTIKAESKSLYMFLYKAKV